MIELELETDYMWSSNENVCYETAAGRQLSWQYDYTVENIKEHQRNEWSL